MPTARRAFRKPIVAASFTLIALAVLELLARLVGAAAPRSSGGEFFGAWRSLLVDLGGFEGADRLFESDPELFWRLRSGVHDVPWHPPLWIEPRSNALGFRDPERSFAAPPGAMRLFCLGDSCTFGMGVRCADSYPQQLEALLARAFSDRVVEVWNGGVPGWTSDQGRTLLLRHGARIGPSIVTVAFGLNDERHWDLAHHKERGHGGCRSDREARAQLASPAARLDRALSHLALYRLLGAIVPRAADPPASAEGGGSRVPDDEFRDNLRAIAAESRRLGAQPLFVVWPIRWQFERRPDAEWMAPTPYQVATREVGRELGLPVLDLLERLAGEQGLFVDSVHMNELGCRRVAEELGRLLGAEKLVPEPPLPSPR